VNSKTLYTIGFLFSLTLFGARFDPLTWHLPPEQAAYLASRAVVLADTAGNFRGSGFFVEGPETPFIVTNAHVAKGSDLMVAYNSTDSYLARVVVRDTVTDVAVLAIRIDSLKARPNTVDRSSFLNDRGMLWQGMATVSASYPMGLGWVETTSPALTFARISQLESPDSMIVLEGGLDLGSSGAPVFTWIEADKGREPHLIGMARSFQVSRTLADTAGDTLVIRSGLFEIVPALVIDRVLDRVELFNQQ
jgi:hypothetical protein